MHPATPLIPAIWSSSKHAGDVKIPHLDVGEQQTPQPRLPLVLYAPPPIPHPPLSSADKKKQKTWLGRSEEGGGGRRKDGWAPAVARVVQTSWQQPPLIDSIAGRPWPPPYIKTCGWAEPGGATPALPSSSIFPICFICKDEQMSIALPDLLASLLVVCHVMSLSQGAAKRKRVLYLPLLFLLRQTDWRH